MSCAVCIRARAHLPRRLGAVPEPGLGPGLRAERCAAHDLRCACHAPAAQAALPALAAVRGSACRQESGLPPAEGLAARLLLPCRLAQPGAQCHLRSRSCQRRAQSCGARLQGGQAAVARGRAGSLQPGLLTPISAGCQRQAGEDAMPGDSRVRHHSQGTWLHWCRRVAGAACIHCLQSY